MKGNIRFTLGVFIILFSLTVPHPGIMVFTGLALIAWAFNARTKMKLFG